MREVIVDTGVVVAWLLLDEDAHHAAVALRERIVQGELEPVVAGHFDFELRSALMQAARRARMAWEEVPRAVSAVGALEMSQRRLSTDDEALLALCRDYGISWADAHWVQLARSEDLAMVTTDVRLAARVPDDVAIVEPLSAMR
jgi:predicted nucleic acid-binding protein